jgi:hypothetical protein
VGSRSLVGTLRATGVGGESLILIKVGSVSEQNSYVRGHPHDCATEAKWEVTSHDTTFDHVSQLWVRCSACGLETCFEFDDSAVWPEGVTESFKHDWKRTY